MTRLLDEAAVLPCLAYVNLNPLRAHLTDSLEAYPHVSIGERLRSLEDEAIDSSSWLAPIAQTNETDGQPVTAVNDLSREELAEVIAEQNGQPLTRPLLTRRGTPIPGISRLYTLLPNFKSLAAIECKGSTSKPRRRRCYAPLPDSASTC